MAERYETWQEKKAREKESFRGMGGGFSRRQDGGGFSRRQDGGGAGRSQRSCDFF